MGWSYSDLAKKTNLPNAKAYIDADKESKKRKAAAKKAEAEKERQEFIDYVYKHTGIKFIPEYKFMPDRKFRMDFANLDLKISIEIDGGIYMEKSGHNSITGILTSMEKRNSAVAMGWRPIHITVQQKFTPYLVELIKRLTAA